MSYAVEKLPEGKLKYSWALGWLFIGRPKPQILVQNLELGSCQ